MKRIPALIAACILANSSAFAVILLDAADPPENKIAPTGDLAGSGWQYEGQWGFYLGTPIAPHFFLTAKHIGQGGGAAFILQGVNYTPVAHFNDPYSDLTIWQVSETFSLVAPLYTKQDESSKPLVVIGRGTERGSDVFLNSTLRGWNWGNGYSVQRWGENDVADIVSLGNAPKNDGLYATFDQSASPNESHLSSGDSGGAVFLNDNGVWKLAAINYAVDDLYTQPSDSSQFTAAIYDARGYYTKIGNNNFVLIEGSNPVPTGFYATRISSKLAWIYSVIDPAGDANANGNSNLLDYALSLNSPLSQGYGGVSVTIENGFLAFTYRKLTNAPGLQYQVEASISLTSWDPVDSQDEFLTTEENVQTIKAKVSIGSKSAMFVRLKITES